MRTLIACVLLLCLGCGGEPRLYRVVGAVSWQGQAIADGHIHFLPEDGNVHPVTAKIENGRYSAKVPQGRMKVEVWADKDLGYSPAMHQNVKTRLIPEEYNSLSKLRFDVQPTDDNVADFALPMK